MADFKYGEFLSQFDCQIDSLDKRETIAYRYVHSDISDCNNFLPPAIQQPQRLFKNKCSSYALSFFENKEGALKRYKRLVKNSENVSKLLGENLAEGNIIDKHGVCTENNNFSHFDLFEFSDSPNFCDSFSIILINIQSYEEL